MIRTTAIILLIFNGISAVFGGGALMNDSTGGILNMPVEMLQYSPFTNFFIPGLILFTIIGLGSLFAGIIVIMKLRGYPFMVIFMGFALSIWISVQILYLKDVHYLHIIYGLLGIILIILGIFLRRKEYGKPF